MATKIPPKYGDDKSNSSKKMVIIIILCVALWWFAWGRYKHTKIPPVQYIYENQEQTK